MAGRKTILVVDDETDVREVITEMLTDEGHRVLSASSGEEALAASDGYRGEIDLLLTDLIMPGMTGRLLADMLSSRRPGISIVFMSGHLDKNRTELYVPGLHYLQKPVTREALDQKVRSVLASARRAAR